MFLVTEENQPTDKNIFTDAKNIEKSHRNTIRTGISMLILICPLTSYKRSSENKKRLADYLLMSML